MSRNIITEELFTCNDCGNVTSSELSYVEAHNDVCLMNKCTKSCLTCKHFSIELQPVFTRNGYEDIRILKELGLFHTGYCDELIKFNEEDMLKFDNECWEIREDVIIPIVESDAYSYWKSLEVTAVMEQLEVDETLETLRAFDTDEERKEWIKEQQNLQ